LANCDAFIHSNPREPFGIAPLQAMASGLPLVAPNCGGILTYASAQNAWLVPPDAQSFASVIKELFAHDKLREERCQRALETAATFCWQKVAASFFELYSEICSLQRAGIDSLDALPAPDFSSSRAVGWRLSLSQKVSGTAEKIFQFAAARFDRPQPLSSRK
jgi:hypothetical protein